MRCNEANARISARPEGKKCRHKVKNEPIGEALNVDMEEKPT